jgi:histidinol phosphatase-like PHP family hydrolase
MPEHPAQVDLHVHAGQERDTTLDELVGTLVRGGVSVMGLLDHSELYEMGDGALKAKMGRIVYASSDEGLDQFYADVARVGRCYEGTAAIFKGLELPEWEILRTTKRCIRPADFVGCHMNTSSHDPKYRHYTKETCGEHLAKRATELLQLCSRHGKPAVLFHPFHRRVQELRAELGSEERLERTEEVFTAEDIQILAEAVSSPRLYIELNFGDIFQAALDPVILGFLRRTCRRLKEAGFSFSLGSDYHRLPDQLRNPDDIVSQLGLGIADLGLVQDLLEQ